MTLHEKMIVALCRQRGIRITQIGMALHFLSKDLDFMVSAFNEVRASDLAAAPTRGPLTLSGKSVL